MAFAGGSTCVCDMDLMESKRVKLIDFETCHLLFLFARGRAKKECDPAAVNAAFHVPLCGYGAFDRCLLKSEVCAQP
ncbi:unnamed protein product [Effrenium voratum]|nr:unnamed protein product [Effrenium voratum]